MVVALIYRCVKRHRDNIAKRAIRIGRELEREFVTLLRLHTLNFTALGDSHLLAIVGILVDTVELPRERCYTLRHNEVSNLILRIFELWSLLGCCCDVVGSEYIYRVTLQTTLLDALVKDHLNRNVLKCSNQVYLATLATLDCEVALAKVVAVAKRSRLGTTALNGCGVVALQQPDILWYLVAGRVFTHQHLRRSALLIDAECEVG